MFRRRINQVGPGQEGRQGREDAGQAPRRGVRGLPRDGGQVRPALLLINNRRALPARKGGRGRDRASGGALEGGRGGERNTKPGGGGGEVSLSAPTPFREGPSNYIDSYHRAMVPVTKRAGKFREVEVKPRRGGDSQAYSMPRFGDSMGGGA